MRFSHLAAILVTKDGGNLFQGMLLRFQPRKSHIPKARCVLSSRVCVVLFIAVKSVSRECKIFYLFFLRRRFRVLTKASPAVVTKRGGTRRKCSNFVQIQDILKDMLTVYRTTSVRAPHSISTPYRIVRTPHI